MEKPEIEIKVFGKNDLSDSFSDEELQGVVDLYSEHEGFSDKDRMDRGVSSVEELKNAIKDTVNFIIAKDKKTNEMVGASRLDAALDVSLLWHNALYVKNNEKYRGKGIGSKILAKIDEIFLGTREQIADLKLECGIEPTNEASKKFHRRLGWENIKTENGENYIYEDPESGKKYEKWERKVA